MSSVAELRRKVDQLAADRRSAQRVLKEQRGALAEATDHEVDCEEAQKTLQMIAQGVQQQAHERIAGVVTKCLASVFDEPYQFRISFEQKRGRTEARLEFVRDGRVQDPLTASGGGAIDVAAFALRLSCLLLAKPPLRRVLVLDEPFKFVSAEYRSRVRLMLDSLSKELKVQFIMVTHIPELKTGNVIEL